MAGIALVSQCGENILGIHPVPVYVNYIYPAIVNGGHQREGLCRGPGKGGRQVL